LPVLLAFSAVLGSGGLAAVASHLVHASDATSSVILLMGMAVGVDYSLFYLKREREERRAGHHHALDRAAATSGRAVLASGVTVLIAMAGMLLTGSKVFDSIGVGAMLVVFIAMVGSLTVLPALLGRLGDKVEKARYGAVAPPRERGMRFCGRYCASRKPPPSCPSARSWCWLSRRWDCTQRCSARETYLGASRSCRHTRRSSVRSQARRHLRTWFCAPGMSTHSGPGRRSSS
jgi:uncharacterized membrane protein YdfJ with MMPL/SSD domain